jgi:hypothetical protein
LAMAESVVCNSHSSWQPSPESRRILDFAMAKIESVPYKVSSRWSFYRVLQAGYLKTKADVTRWDYLSSRARKRFFGKWRPGTLKDSIRRCDWNGEFRAAYSVELDSLETQPFIVQCWYEAEAMSEQFEYYTADYRVSLVPFRGDCSVPIKWEMAKKLEELFEEYLKPIKILYFGDCDKKGLQILEAALRDIRAWCKVPFDVERVGLTEEQAKAFGFPENPDKPGYQWEALEDEQAKKLILDALNRYAHPVPAELLEREKHIRERFRKAYAAILNEELGGDYQ